MILFPDDDTPLEELQTYRQMQRLLEAGLQQTGNYWNFGYSLLTAAFPTLRDGLIYIIAPENVGKSMYILNWGYNVLQYTENSRWLDFSLDDSEGDRWSYLLARSGDLPINLIKQAGHASDEEKNARRLAFGQFFQRYGRRYIQISSSTEENGMTLNAGEEFTFTVEEVDQMIRANREKLGPDVPLFITVDSFHDLDVRQRGLEDENSKLAYKSKLLKRCATQTGSLIVMTAHTRKDSRRRGLQADALKGEGRILYDAKAICHLFSDLNLNRDAATLYWEERQPDGMPEKRPVHELDIQKNKAGSFKGVLFYNYEPRRCFDLEVDEATQSYYRNQLFRQ